MPKENKHSRGRREEKKRKREQDEDTALENKRHKPQDPAAEGEAEAEDGGIQSHLDTDNANIAEKDGEVEVTERPFYGMLEDEEQEYFRRADELLELNDFPEPEERDLFLANVYREADGKELKIACSQSCSRLMERLILLSTVEQKKKLFEKFAGNFTHLVQHRFASHCCETLFIQSAPVVTEELTADSEGEGAVKDVSMENLFLSTLDELEGQMTFLLTDRFASHTLRVLLIILSGRALEQEATRSLLRSKRKEKVSIHNFDNTPSVLSLNKRSVPSSFQFAVEKIISDTIATMDTAFIRVLASHPTGNPSLQLLLELELTNPNSRKGSNSSEKTIISALLPDDVSSENSESAIFINGIVYDPIGSRLLETICTHAPGKLFKQIYRTIFKDRIASFARNEISSYVVIRVLNRLSKEDLDEAATDITPHIAGLISRSRTIVVKTLLERCHARSGDTSELTSTVFVGYGSDLKTLILKMACIDDINYLSLQLLPAIDLTSEPEGAPEPPKLVPKATPQQLHGSLLAQAMLSIPGPACTLIQDGLLNLTPEALLTLALWMSTSHILQASLTPISNSFSVSPPQSSNLTFRRKLLNSLLSTGEAVSLLAQSTVGTHILDSILLSAPTLLSLVERIAITLSALEADLRESFTGRIVWRNWSMDLFKRKRGDWVKKVQGSVAGQTGKGYVNDAVIEKDSKGVPKGKGKVDDGKKKTGIELAREKYARDKAKKGTGVNKIVV
ncbi:Pumilio domain-containing NOP9 [Hyphodiscus hymeniophilus]|uniref:Nucleolar protein 9 n=1 Tax=Hyphodiscus hymeniophilus TaxID=353542 RepID=A0A9P6VFV0_9HELO|nr:Pumilio domain-containing NOP9 [Hyphodiscus hymeniophilus]